jgi:hypothetical protein
VRSDYVTYVGDDDALLPGALPALASIIQDTNASAITWKWASYFWPDSLQTMSRNLLFVPAGQKLLKRSATQTLREVLEFRRGYEQLPFFYKGIVSTKLINQVRDASGGVFFHSMVPDIYSAIALSVIADDYYYSFRPYSLNGTSAASNGAAHFTPSLNAAAARIFLSEDNIPFHSDLAFAPSISIAVAESFFQVRDRIERARGHTLRIEKLLTATMREIASSEPERYSRVRDALRVIAAKHGLINRLESLLRIHPNRFNATPIGLKEGFNLANRTHIVNCAQFGVKNIHQAAYLCAAIIEASKIGFMRSPVAILKTTAALAKGVIGRVVRNWTKSI